MELDLSLGDTISKTFDGVTAKARKVFTRTAPTSPSPVGSCSLGFCIAVKRPSDGTKEDDNYNTSEDQQILNQNPRIKAVNYGSSDGGSSGNEPAGVGFNFKSILVAPEEATSPLRLDFGSHSGTGPVFGKINSIVEMERTSSRASDEDENVVYRKKLKLSKQQSVYLEESFKDHSTLNPKQKIELARKLNLSPRQVEVWFQNRRARSKLKQTEVDCEYLKKCCEKLTEENKRLHKELQELRAVKTTSNPLCVQIPMCVRVAATTTTAFPLVPPPLDTKFRESILPTTPCTSFPQSSKRTSLYPFPYVPLD